MHRSISLVYYRAAQVHRPAADHAIQLGDFVFVHGSPHTKQQRRTVVCPTMARVRNTMNTVVVEGDNPRDFGIIRVAISHAGSSPISSTIRRPCSIEARGDTC